LRLILNRTARSTNLQAIQLDSLDYLLTEVIAVGFGHGLCDRTAIGTTYSLCHNRRARLLYLGSQQAREERAIVF